MTLVRDLIDVPEAIYSGDFVLRLSEGVERSQETLDQYVVTPELAKNFDEALGLIKSALQSRSSKAAYLHGSFGSGKSHLMAVLHMLLEHDANARSKEGLAEVVHKHTDWLAGKKFLLPTYHMIGAESLEAAVLGGYAEYVRRVRPDAPVPAVYKTDAVLQNVARTRELLGDDRFFDELNKRAAGGEDGWGALAAAWTSDAYDVAAAGDVTDREHQRLIADVIAAFLPEFASLARGDAAAFVGIDEGLAVMSQHAERLGYDAVVLFLDELILWLMTRLGDQKFVAEEASKVAKLVEAESANRPIPLVSFVARQRDLRELAGQDIPGAEQLALLDTLKWWQGRFAVIELQDTNLPAIAEQRVLRPKSDTARAEIGAAFDRVLGSLPQSVLDALLAEDGDKALFRQTYPFTPAFMKTLVAASSVLQRQRTALRLMVQLLVDRRDDLTIDEIIPVGDLYDILAEGDEPFSAEMQRHFAAARTLYERKLRPTLLREHTISEDEAETNVAFLADDRLVKTLLLAALVPDVEPLRVLDARRLTALNHGQVRALFAGQELGLVVNKLRSWAAAVGEIRLSDDSTNPTVTVQLTGIDVDAIIARADAADTEGERRRLVRRMLLDEFGVDLRTQGQLIMEHRFVWRCSDRSVELAFENVRDRELLPDAAMRSQSSGWKVIVDLPFDDETHRPTDDRARVQDYLDGNAATKTLCWLPNFLSRDLQRDLGTLVKLEYLLTGERFDQHAADQLSPVERPQARMLLDNQRSALRERIRMALAQAYAATTPTSGIIDPVLEVSEHFQSLDPELGPRPPVGPTLDKALEGLLEQVMEYEYPEHPKFESAGALKIGALRTVHEEVVRATASQDGRIEVEPANRRVLSGIAQPLKLGTMHETAFVLDHFWKDHFDQQHAAAGDASMTVGALRGYLDLPTRRGLGRTVQNLVILTYAAQTNRSFTLHGGAYANATLDQLPDELELREQTLPADATWSEARDRASRLFGLAPSPLATGASVAGLVSDLKARATAARDTARLLVGRLGDRLNALGIERDSSDRYVAASSAADLIEGISSAADDEVIETLFEASVAPTVEAVAASLVRAEAVATELGSIQWPVIDAAIRLELDEATALKTRLVTLLQHDEHSAPVGSQLQSIQAEASDLLGRQAPPPPGPTPPGPTPPPAPPPGKTYTRVDANRVVRAEPSPAKEELERIGAELTRDADLRLTIDWTIEREDSA